MVSHVVSEGPLSDAAFEGMVNKFLAFENVVQESAREGPLFQDQNVAPEGPISDSQFEEMVRNFANFGEMMRSQTPLEHSSIPPKPNGMLAHPGSENPELDVAVGVTVDRFRGLEVSGHYFVAKGKTFVGDGDAQTQLVKVEPRSSDTRETDTVARESRETGIEESRLAMKGGKAARLDTEEGEVSTGEEEIPELEECEAESVEYTFSRLPCLSRGETWMRTRCRNHGLHVDFPETLERDVEDTTVHYFFPDFDYGRNAAWQGPA